MKRCQECHKNPIEYSARKHKEYKSKKVCGVCADKLKSEGYVIVTY